MSREKVSPVWNQLHDWVCILFDEKKLFDLLKIMISGLFSSVE